VVGDLDHYNPVFDQDSTGLTFTAAVFAADNGSSYQEGP